MSKKSVGTIEDVREYLSLHPEILEREDNNRGHMERVMTLLTHENMERLERQFQLYSRGLELPTFIYLMRQLYVPDNELSKYFFVSDLIKFFQAIDINGDGHLEWSQFTEYIIENIRVIEKPKYKNKNFEENQIISSAYSKISNEYKILHTYDINCQNSIKKVLYCNDQYFVLEHKVACIRIFNSDFQQQDTLQLEGSSFKSYIIDFSLDKQNCVIGIIFEEGVHFCNLNIKATKKYINHEGSPSLKECNKIEYLRLHKLWAIAKKNGEIVLASVVYNTRIAMSFCQEHVLNHHESTITDIIETQEPFSIATSSLDGNVRLYSIFLQQINTFDYISEQTASVINQKQRKGILGISYTSQFGNHILAFGFSSDVYIYCLDISLTKGYVGRYSEHSGVIVWAKFMKFFPYVISFDNGLNLRIWDFRKFETIQMINCLKVFINPSHLCLVPDVYECLICEKKITRFRAPALEKKSKEINEFHDIFDIRYCSFTNCLFAFTSNDVRVYNYYTGTLKRLFTKLYESSFETNITAAEFGYKCKRFFVGDAAGYVREFCSETGDLLQDINPKEEPGYDNKEIKSIIFLKDHSLLMCCSIDGRIMIYERNSDADFKMVRDLRDCHEDLVCVAASSRYCLLATGGEDGCISIWNLDKYAFEGLFELGSTPIGIFFSPIHPIMLVATADGFISLIYVRPYEGKNKYKVFARVLISEKQQRIASFSAQLINSSQSTNNPLLDSLVNYHLMVAVGTDLGESIIVNLTPLLKLHKIQQNHQLFTIKSCQRSETQNMRGLVTHERNRNLLSVNSCVNMQVYPLSDFKHLVINTGEASIEKIVLSKEHDVIFTKSTDKRLKVWNMNKQCNGVINFSTFKKMFWRTPPINLTKKLQAIDTTIYSIKLIESQKFSTEDEETIKVHLLLNEFLPWKDKAIYYEWLENRDRMEHSGSSVKVTTGAGVPKQSQKCISEAEFNQIYTKLVTSINKSLGEEYVKEHMKTRSAANLPKKGESDKEPDKGHTRSKLIRNRLKDDASGKKKEPNSHKKEIPTENRDPKPAQRIWQSPKRKQEDGIESADKELKLSLETCFHILNHKVKSQTNCPEVKKKTMLFTSLKSAQKQIERSKVRRIR